MKRIMIIIRNGEVNSQIKDMCNISIMPNVEDQQDTGRKAWMNQVRKTLALMDIKVIMGNNMFNVEPK